MNKVNTYSVKTKTVTKTTLPKEMFSQMNKDLLAQAIHVYRDRQHKGTSKVQTRSDVTMTKAKIYRQKGTGNARHGAKSAPIFVGGGVAHGPKGVKRVLSMPKKMRQRALKVAFTAKADEQALVAAKGIDGIKKTKEAKELVSKIVDGEKIKPSNKMLVLLSDKSNATSKFFRNIKNVKTMRFGDANAYDTYIATKVIIDADALSKPTKKEATK